MGLEGMVHALENIWRILKPGGLLIDIHPVSERYFIEAYRDGKLLFSERVREDESKYVLHAEQALSSVTESGLFTFKDSAEFDFIIYADSAHELNDYWDSLDAFDDQPDPFIAEREKLLFAKAGQILEASGECAQATVREKIRITSLRALSR